MNITLKLVHIHPFYIHMHGTHIYIYIIFWCSVVQMSHARWGFCRRRSERSAALHTRAPAYVHRDTRLRCGDVSQRAISLFLPLEVQFELLYGTQTHFKTFFFFKKKEGAWQVLVRRYSSRPPNRGGIILWKSSEATDWSGTSVGWKEPRRGEEEKRSE